MEAKRRALGEIAMRQRAADEKREEEVEPQQQAGAAFQSPLFQEDLAVPALRNLISLHCFTVLEDLAALTAWML